MNAQNGTACAQAHLSKFADGLAIGPVYPLWRALQEGQEKIVRWSYFKKKLGDKIRSQTGHDHQCSITALATCLMIRMRPYVRLNELLLTRCFMQHDVPEGILGEDKRAGEKSEFDDLQEYLAYERLYGSLPLEIWQEMQRAFLLQFCLSGPKCFPQDAQNVMLWLATFSRNEALFFQGVQNFDYLLYGHECLHERGEPEIFIDVAKNHMKAQEMIAEELPGFRQVIWTEDVKNYCLGQITIAETPRLAWYL